MVLWRLLPKVQHPDKIEITLDSPCLPESMNEFLLSLKSSEFEGELSLDLKGSLEQMEPCDEILLNLKDSRQAYNNLFHVIL